jgi:hypothetical protein
MPTHPFLPPSARCLLSCLLVIAVGCERGERPLFELLPPEQTGVTFANTITAHDSVNVQRDVYLYNGAGVAVGDIDGDGLPDLFFAGNMVSSRLYRNLGGMKFEDVTERAGVKTTRWATGATMVDIDGDGDLDIYVSVSGPDWSTPAERANLLFINDGHGHFTEEADRYGVADTGFTTHAAFLDYDGDGCLDLFLLENAPTDFSRSNLSAKPTGMNVGTPNSYNQLYHNDCHGRFTNATEKAGILRTAGYGLGVVVADFNRDGRPDIYVSNDAAPNDVLYVNNGDGTFTDKSATWLKHASFAGMGVDAADFNDDGWPDIMQVDMMPRSLARQKRVSGYLTYANLLESRSRGFRDDYSVNSLQLSNGITPQGDVVFSEIGRLAGVSHTDWSWSALFADFDNDGAKDIFIGNGYPKAVNDLDYVNAVMAARRLEPARQAAGIRRDELRLPQPGRPDLRRRVKGVGDGRAQLLVRGRLRGSRQRRPARSRRQQHRCAGVHLSQRPARGRASLARRPPRRRCAQSPGDRRDARAHRGGKEAVPLSVALSRLHVHGGRASPLRARQRNARRQPPGHLARWTAEGADGTRR